MSFKTGKSGPKTVLEALMKEVGVDFPLSGHFYREIVPSMNGLTGMSGEFLVHAAVAGWFPLIGFALRDESRHLGEHGVLLLTGK